MRQIANRDCSTSPWEVDPGQPRVHGAPLWVPIPALPEPGRHARTAGALARGLPVGPDGPCFRRPTGAGHGRAHVARRGVEQGRSACKLNMPCKFERQRSRPRRRVQARVRNSSCAASAMRTDHGGTPRTRSAAGDVLSSCRVAGRAAALRSATPPITCSPRRAAAPWRPAARASRKSAVRPPAGLRALLRIRGTLATDEAAHGPRGRRLRPGRQLAGRLSSSSAIANSVTGLALLGPELHISQGDPRTSDANMLSDSAQAAGDGAQGASRRSCDRWSMRGGSLTASYPRACAISWHAGVLEEICARDEGRIGDACDIVTVLGGDQEIASVLNFYFRDEVPPYHAVDAIRARGCRQ